MAEQKMSHGSKHDLNQEKYGKLKLVRLYLWSAELRKNQLLSKISKMGYLQMNLYYFQDIH